MPPNSQKQPAFTVNVLALSLLVLLLWCGAFLWPRYIEPRVLTISVNMWPPAETLILAKQAGDLDPTKVNLVEINWSSAAMRAVGNRVADVAVLSLDELVRQKALGYPLKVILVTDISKGADALMVRPEIKTLQDLKGKRVGVESRTASVWLLHQALVSVGMKMEDVELVPMNPAETEDMFMELMLDAVVVSDPWRSQVHRMGLVALYDSSQPGSQIIRVLAVHEEALALHRLPVEDIVKAHLKWSAPLQSGKLEILQPLLRREGLTKEEFTASLKQLQIPDLAQNRAWLSGRDPMINQQLAKVTAELNSFDPSVGSPDLSEVLDPSILLELP